jgi:hypothetical protein
MRRLRISLVLVAASAGFLGAQMDPPSRVGRLNYREGPVSFQPTGINDWVDADINRPLTTGDNIDSVTPEPLLSFPVPES